MKKTTTLLLVAISLFSLNANAQSNNEKKADSSKVISKKEGLKSKKQHGKMTAEEKEMFKKTIQEKAANMSPEDKKAFRDNMKEKYDAMSPAEKKEMRTNLKKKYESLTPEEQQKVKEHMKSKSDSNGNRGPRRRSQL